MFRSDMPLLWVPSRKILMHVMPFWHIWFVSLFAVDSFTDFSSVIHFEWVQIIRLNYDILCQWAENCFTKKSTNLAAKLDLLPCFKAAEDLTDKSFVEVKTKERIKSGKVWKLTPRALLWVFSTCVLYSFTYHVVFHIHL